MLYKQVSAAVFLQRSILNNNRILECDVQKPPTGTLVQIPKEVAIRQPNPSRKAPDQNDPTQLQ